MKRDLKTISSGILDVLVVGGGIHGAAIAYHATKAGYRTAILDKNDFCGATSANSLKILHGGLRYLQHGNIQRMRHSILSRREMMRLAPYLVRPLPCMMPLYGGGLNSKTVMRAALFINDCVSWDRNRGLPSDLKLPGGHVVSKEKCLKVVPGINGKSLHGAAVWYDVLAMDTERLVLEYILESISYGAEAANYAEVREVRKDNDDNYRVTVQDHLCGQKNHITARYIINAAGPWFDEQVFSSADQNKSSHQKWALALNVVSKKKIFDEYAVALEGHGSYRDSDSIVKRDKRLYFFVPWRGYTMIGTEYEASPTGLDGLDVKRETIQNMVDEINAIYPPANLQYEDISFFHAGLLPMQSSSQDENIQLEKNSTFVAHEDRGAVGVLSLRSVKYTTAPHIAHEVVGYLAKRYQPSHAAGQKKSMSITQKRKNVSKELNRLLQKKYGRRAERIFHYMDGDHEDGLWIGKKPHLLKAEVAYLVAEEMACHLTDIVFRRTGLGTAECPSQNILHEAAAYMGNILGWDEDAKKEEVEAVLRRYAPLVSPNA